MTTTYWLICMGIDNVKWVPSCLKLNPILKVYLMNFEVMGINLVNFIKVGSYVSHCKGIHC